MPTLRAIYGYVATQKLVEVVSADLGVQPRHGYRELKKAIDEEWIKQFPHKTKGNITDNHYNSSRQIPEKMTKLTQLRIEISNVVCAQLANPQDFGAGKGLLSETTIYMHPVETALSLKRHIMTQKTTKVRHVKNLTRETIATIVGGAIAATVFALVLVATIAPKAEVRSGEHQIETVDRVDGWGKIVG